MASLHLCFASVALLCSALSAHAGVLVVDKAGGPGADYTEIQAAVTAASEGDTILVRDGLYQGFVLDGKSLVLVADGVGVQVSNVVPLFGGEGPTMRIRNLASHQEVVVRGLHADSGVVVQNCAGAVWIDEVSVSGDVSCSTGGTAGAFVTGPRRPPEKRPVVAGSNPASRAGARDG